MNTTYRSAEAIRKAQTRLLNLQDLRKDLSTVPESLRYVFLQACEEKLQRVLWVEEGQQYGN